MTEKILGEGAALDRRKKLTKLVAEVLSQAHHELDALSASVISVQIIASLEPWLKGFAAQANGATLAEGPIELVAGERFVTIVAASPATHFPFTKANAAALGARLVELAATMPDLEEDDDSERSDRTGDVGPGGGAGGADADGEGEA